MAATATEPTSFRVPATTATASFPNAPDKPTPILLRLQPTPADPIQQPITPQHPTPAAPGKPDQHNPEPNKSDVQATATILVPKSGK